MENIDVRFGVLDYVVFCAVLAVSASIGVYYRFTGGKQRTFKEYLLADQQMPVLPVAFSLMASFMSAITLLGVCKENYMFGTQFVVINISYIISTPIVCYLYLPIFFRLQKTSVYEYLECRFGRPTRLCASIAFTLQMALYMGIVLFAPALALAAVTGISLRGSIIGVGIVCTFYSALGGMKAVLITDVFQSMLMFITVFVVIIRGLIDYGFDDIITAASDSDRLEFFNTSTDPRTRHTIWNLGIGGIFIYCSLYGVNQAQVQRLLTLKSLRSSQASLWIQWPILMVLSMSTSFAGLVIYTHYRHCDPALSGRINNTDQLFPLYVVETMGTIPGMSGLFVSGIFSGSLSTVSSALNSLAAVTVYDYLMTCIPRAVQLSEVGQTRLTAIIAMLYGVLCIGIAFVAVYFGSGVLQASLTVFGAVGGPLLGVFTLGMVCRSANQKGALTGLILGLIISLWIGFGQPKPAPVYKSRSIEGCSLLNTTFTTNNISVDLTNNTFTSFLNEDSIMMITNTTEDYLNPDVPQPKSSNFLHELYAISYMWLAALGFSIVMLIGMIVSILTGGNKTHLDPSLFVYALAPRQTNFDDYYHEQIDTEKNSTLIPSDFPEISSEIKLTKEDAEVTRL